MTKQNFFARSFKGRMDEFAVLSRAVGAQEIARIHESGLPAKDLPTQLAEARRAAK